MQCSSTPSMSQKANVDNCVITFGTLCFDKNETVPGAPVPSSSLSVSPGEISEDQLQETRIVEEETKGPSSSSSSSSSTISLPNLPPSPDLNAFMDSPATSSNSQQNIWASPYFYNGGNTIPQNIYATNYAPGNCYESQGGQPGVDSFHAYSSIYENLGLNYPSGPVVLDGNNNKISWDVNTQRERSSYNYMNLALATPSAYTRQLETSLPEFNFLKMATSLDGSEQLKRILEQGKYLRETMRDVFPSIIQLMTDQYGHRIFDILLERCEISDLHAIVRKMSSETEPFLGAAFCERGSRSIQRLIKRLKNTGMEYVITLVLSKSAWQLMTHKIASHVFRQCFLVLGDEPNRALHDSVFALFLPLAMDPIGCITINTCIDGITSVRRAELLNLVAHYASQLSHDPSGNFVVQHVLNLHNELATQKICLSLEGHYVQLAQKKGGSHVVEKCLQSHFGRSLVMNEIFKNEKTLLTLAKDRFGNYVIQTALKVTMIHDRDMCTKLVQVLEPKHPKIVHKVNGNHVNNQMREPSLSSKEELSVLLVNSFGQ